MHSPRAPSGLGTGWVAVGNAMGGLDFAAEVGIVVYWHPPRSRDTRGQHLSVRLSSVSSALEMSVPAAFEVPSHHSPPSAAPACGLRFQTSNSETEPQSCSLTVQEESLVEMESVLGKES
jgi:hypothetical protein